MIVKCEQCQTRFKIPDDKVTDKGVKVRCTKCSHTFRVTRDMAQPANITGVVPAVPAPPPAGADPFARFGAPAAELPTAEVTRPGVFALGVEATRSPDLGARRPAAPAYPSTAPRTNDAPFDFGSLAPPQPATLPAVPAYAPPAAPSPFDFAAIAPPPGPAAPAPAAFDFSTFAAPVQQAPMAPPRPPPASAPVAASTPAFDFSPPPPPPQTAPEMPAFDFGGPQSSAPMDSAMTQPSMPAMSADGFFGGPSDSGAVSPADGEAARAMFDVPAPPPSSLPDIPLPQNDPAPSAASQVESLAVPKSTVPRPVAAAPVINDAPAPRRSVFGIVVNVGIAAVLVLGLVVIGSAFLNEGKVTADSLSLENLKNTFAPSVDFVASDVSNGLYETRAGRSVFFVRGEVTNRSQATVKVVVKAEIVEDGSVVRSGESWAGEPATPEEIFLIDGADALEALNRKVEKRALVVPPDSAAAFVVPFTEYPPELKGFRVRVSARAVPVNPTAANP